MSDPSLSTALKEAYACAPRNQLYHTLELRHTAISPPIRVVQGSTGISAKLEATAPVNPDETVAWTAFPFEVKPPEVMASGSPRLMVEFSNVSQTVMAAIEATLETSEPVEITYRMYLANGLTVGPENNPPINLVARTVRADPLRIVIEAGYPDVGQKRFPAQVYDTQDFPGLSR